MHRPVNYPQSLLPFSHYRNMSEVLSTQTLLALGFVASLVAGATITAKIFLHPHVSLKARSIFLWLAFDALCHTIRMFPTQPLNIPDLLSSSGRVLPVSFCQRTHSECFKVLLCIPMARLCKGRCSLGHCRSHRRIPRAL